MSADRKFEAGDVVRLKCGGVRMLVICNVDYEGVECQWLTAEGNLMTKEFLESHLVKSEPVKS